MSFESIGIRDDGQALAQPDRLAWFVRRRHFTSSGAGPFYAEARARIYRTYFSSQEALPARTRMQAGRTPMDCALEVEAIAYVPRT